MLRVGVEVGIDAGIDMQMRTERLQILTTDGLADNGYQVQTRKVGMRVIHRLISGRFTRQI